MNLAPEKIIYPEYPALLNAIFKDNCIIHIYRSMKRYTRVVEVIKVEAAKKGKPKTIKRGYGEADFLSEALTKADLSYSRGGMIEEYKGTFGAAGSEGGIDKKLYEGIEIYLEKAKNDDFIAATLTGGTTAKINILAHTIDHALNSLYEEYKKAKNESNAKTR